MFDSTKFLQATAERWAAKASCEPEAKERIERGLVLALAGKVSPLTAGSFRVAGSKKGTEYTVLVNNGWPSCSCPDFQRGRASRCKHIWASALMARLTAEIVEQMKTPKPRKPRQDGLSRACAEHHKNNHKLANVIPLRR